VRGETLTVATDGSAPYTTIQSAVDAAQSGDRIVVRSGEYFEAVRVTGKDHLTFEGEGEVWIKSSGMDEIFTILSCFGIHVSGLKGIHLSSETCYNNVFGIQHSADIAITRCVMNGSGIYGLDASDSRDLTITDNIFTRCTSTAISIARCENVKIERNAVVDNDAWQGIYISRSNDVRIANNTLARNRLTPIDFESGERLAVHNNIIAFNELVEQGSGGVTVRSGGSLELRRNVVHANRFEGNVTNYWGTYPMDDIDADPMFQSLTADHVGLLPGSVCLGAGTDGTNIGAAQGEGGLLSVRGFDDEFNEGVRLLNNRNYAESLPLFQRLTTNYPDRAEGYIGLGNSYLGLRYFEEAVRAYHECLRLKPSYDIAYYNLACAASLQWRVDEALYYLELSFQAGYSDQTSVLSDPDLEAVRQAPQFHSLMARYFPTYNEPRR
jgi:parallel beta-helix repeat protein